MRLCIHSVTVYQYYLQISAAVHHARAARVMNVTIPPLWGQVGSWWRWRESAVWRCRLKEQELGQSCYGGLFRYIWPDGLSNLDGW